MHKLRSVMFGRTLTHLDSHSLSAIVPLSMLFGDAADMFFVGGEARLHFVVNGNSYAGFELLAHAGVRL